MAAQSTYLALDLSTPRGSLAVVRGECGSEVLFDAAFQSERSHNAQVFAPLAQALDVAGENLSGVIIGTGPGSYTGVRIAIAAAQGIALARGVWCLGWSSLTAPRQHAGSDYQILGDARRQSYYIAQVRAGRLQPQIETVSAEEALNRVSPSASADLPWLSFDAKAPLALPHILLEQPEASRLAQRALALGTDERQSLIEQPLTPHYLAEAFITVARPFLKKNV